MTDIEIPYASERGKRYRFFEMLPGLLTWSILLMPFVLSLFSPALTVAFILAYLLMWFVKSVGLNVRAIQGYRLMHKQQKLDWQRLLNDVQQGEVTSDHKRPKWHLNNLSRLKVTPNLFKPADIIHVAIIATYKESREVLEPTINSVLDADYDKQRLIIILAYEERGGAETEARAQELIAACQGKCRYVVAIKHPHDIPGEIIGKGGNVTYAARQLQKYLEQQHIDPLNVIVTTLDADNRPHASYFLALSYTYSVCYDPVRASFQPIPMYTNNIWDAPAPMRVVATGNSFWNIILSLRPHMLRNFSSHAQGMKSLIDTNFWSVRTIVEDGHQFWRTYFRYDGEHTVYPIFLPIYQDAVLASRYLRTLKMQFIQVRRWAWGASDIPYVAEKGFFTRNKVPKLDLFLKFCRLIESHVSWAIAPILITFASFIPVLFNREDYGANQLPFIASRIQTIALVGVFATLFLSLKILPPKPERYKRHRTVLMVLQWVFLPVTTIVFNALAALYSQTRLLFGWYLGTFDVTEKTVVTEQRQKIT